MDVVFPGESEVWVNHAHEPTRLFVVAMRTKRTFAVLRERLSVLGICFSMFKACGIAGESSYVAVGTTLEGLASSAFLPTIFDLGSAQVHTLLGNRLQSLLAIGVRKALSFELLLSIEMLLVDCLNVRLKLRRLLLSSLGLLLRVLLSSFSGEIFCDFS